MKVMKYFPKGDEKGLEEEISSILRKHFPAVSRMENEFRENNLIGNEYLNRKMKISLSFSYLMLNKRNKIKEEGKISKISLQVEKPEGRVNPEIYFG